MPLLLASEADAHLAVLWRGVLLDTAVDVLSVLLHFATGDDDDDDVDSGDDDDEGWITPSNVEATKQATVALTQSQVADVPVACVTTDYAIQVSLSSAFHELA